MKQQENNENNQMREVELSYIKGYSVYTGDSYFNGNTARPTVYRLVEKSTLDLQIFCKTGGRPTGFAIFDDRLMRSILALQVWGGSY